MTTTYYRIGTDRLAIGSAPLQSALEAAKLAMVRPLCLCREPGVPMYVARAAGQLIVKRMPESGGDHAPSCDSYEPPPELSGLGQMLGTAVREDPDAGLTALKLDFSLTKTAGRAAPSGGDGEVDSVATDGHKLSLRGTLHYLWDQAGFNRWSPAMEGRRTWGTVHKFLLAAAEGKVTKGGNLSDSLFVPETFSVERKAEIAARRAAQIGRATADKGKGSRRLLLIVAEIKEIGPSRYGHRIVFKHLADTPFMLNDDLHKRLAKHFARELGLWDAFEDSHLIAAATFGVNAAGIPSVEELALMITTSNWIPFENRYDKEVLDALTANRRRFAKGLRYNLASQIPLACAVASDTQPAPTAMYVVAPDASQAHRDALSVLLAQSKLPHWVWHAGADVRPELP